MSPTPVVPLRPGLFTRLGNRELLEPNTPFAVNAGTALVRNFASAPGAAETRLALPTKPPKEPPIVGGGVKDNPKGLGEAVTVPKIMFRANFQFVFFQNFRIFHIHLTQIT